MALKTNHYELISASAGQLERWIGGIYNWKSANWDWGVSGEKVKYRNFGATEQPAESRGSGFGMSCIVLDPGQQYKWASRSCLEPKYFVCEVPAGRTGKSKPTLSFLFHSFLLLLPFFW